MEEKQDEKAQKAAAMVKVQVMKGAPLVHVDGFAEDCPRSRKGSVAVVAGLLVCTQAELDRIKAARPDLVKHMRPLPCPPPKAAPAAVAKPEAPAPQQNDAPPAPEGEGQAPAQGDSVPAAEAPRGKRRDR